MGVPRKRTSPVPSSAAASKRMAATGQRDTSAETRIRKRLFAQGLRYRVDYPVLRKPRRKADIVFTRAKVAVFVDGCFWHGCLEHGSWPKANSEFWRNKIETNRERDKDTDRRLNDIGWYVVRIWEHEDPEIAVKRIIEAVYSRTKNMG
ncbi:very short patch repair endonuclease [Microbulbifer harenosus]|uniref:Very short patch repair endonuclease n=1 Tax=Microbulbifer harenosus TaxID=2576840 RepID=A0ABY2UL56_9GAMM|nr:very short patch repair endonuclease [Microbulbifer harenosus]